MSKVSPRGAFFAAETNEATEVNGQLYRYVSPTSPPYSELTPSWSPLQRWWGPGVRSTRQIDIVTRRQQAEEEDSELRELVSEQEATNAHNR